jgi:flavin-dependent dehydrogenase
MSEAREADVIVVGAGPGGSATAFHLARHGLRVELLEKSEFPREKVCGDGLTPRAVRQLVAMGIDTSGEGWARNRGLRVIGGGIRMELDWPKLASFPDYGLTRTRTDFDDILAKAAVKAGAALRTSTNVTGPVFSDGGRVVGVRAEVGPDKEPVAYTAPLVVAADGVSGRFPPSATTARSGSPSAATTGRPPGTRTTTSNPGWSCAVAVPRRSVPGRPRGPPGTSGTTCFFLVTDGCSGWGTVGSTSGSACSTRRSPSAR